MNHRKIKIHFTLVAVILGFMIAIQFQTVKAPAERDTRDMWQLREALLKEKELQTSLVSEIRSNEDKLSIYDSKQKQSKEQVLSETLAELKLEAGLTKVTGPGITLKITPALEAMEPGQHVVQISPELLQRLVNELNMYQAKYVSIDGQRIINTTVIRDINKETKIDGHAIRTFPVVVKVIVDNLDEAEKLYNRMNVSKSRDDFYTESLILSTSKPEKSVTIPAYDQPLRIRFMSPENGEGVS